MSETNETIRTCVDIDREWLFVMDDVDGGQEEDFDDSSWQRVRIPHDWTVDCLPDRNNHIPMFRVGGHLEIKSDSFLPKCVGWYRRNLKLPDSYRNRRVFLEFEGVFRNCTIWVNGRQAGQHLWGYTGFVIDITPFVRLGRRDNMIAVRVDATKCEGWWCEGSGIYRHVWLIATSDLHVDQWGTFVTTPEVSESRAVVSVRTTLRNATGEEARGILETVILDGENNCVTKDKCNVAIPADAAEQFLQELAINSPRLWSPDSPNLYRAESTIEVDGHTVDTYETPFGVRWFEFTADKGFSLNGERVQIRGANIHHDYGGLGTALPDRANFKTIEELKKMGCNALRPGHIAAAPALMDACDRLGMLFFAETRYLPLNPPEETIPPLIELIRRDRNHPCIVVWTLGNTGGVPHGGRYLTDWLEVLNDVANKEDPTRPTSLGLEGNADANENGFAMVTDLVGYNGGGMDKDDADHERYPDRKIYISEYAAGAGTRGVYEHDATEYETIYLDIAGNTRRLRGGYSTIYYACERHEKEWAHVAQRPWLGGGLMWAGIDYRGETAGWPTVISQFGVMDICRFPKDVYYYYKQQWCDEPIVHVFPHWTWVGREGQTIKLWCYCNCNEVELLLNDTSLGRKPSQPLGHIEWEVAYEPGTLIAAGINDGQVVCRQKIQTAGLPAGLQGVADRQSILADGNDLSFVTLSVHDDHGSLVPMADNFVKVTVEGHGALIGMCSGDPRSHELARSNVMRAFNGLVLAIVQSNDQPGPISLIARSAELSEVRIDLTAE